MNLEKNFPFPYRITKGNIIDSYNQRRASIDCIILDPSHPYTIDSKNKKASVIFADGVDYAIEIKGNLTDKDEIERALKQIESVKKLTRVRNGLIWDKDKTDKKTLAVLLFLMANMPLVHPTYNENIYKIYLDKIFTKASYRDDWNKFLEDIENS